MTKQGLERGQDIQMAIRDLRYALGILNKDNFFKIESSSCGMSTQADPFLAQLHIKLKTEGVEAITKEIARLEKEFTSL